MKRLSSFWCAMVWRDGLHLYLLENNPDACVWSGYVGIKNNANKMLAELAAIDRLKPLLKQRFHDRFFHRGTLLTVDVADSQSGGQASVWLMAMLLTTPAEIDAVAVGYVMNAQAQAHFSLDPPRLIFPLAKMGKPWIASRLSTKLRKHTVYCERPKANGYGYVPCGTCVACKRHKQMMVVVSCFQRQCSK